MQGIYAAIPTPFNAAGELYPAKLQHNIATWNRTAIAGFAVATRAGEGALLSFEERARLFGMVAEHNVKATTLIAGVTEQSVVEAVRVIRSAHGYHAALLAAPHEGDAGLFFRTVADRSPVPVIVESDEAFAHPNIIGSRRGEQYLISNFASAVPFAYLTVFDAKLRRDAGTSEDWQRRIDVAERAFAPHGPGGLKLACERFGYYGGPVRLPLRPPEKSVHPALTTALSGLRG